MRLCRGLPSLAAAMLILPTGFMVIRAHPAGAPGGAQAAAPQAGPAVDDPILIRGRTIDEWLTRLENRDPGVRQGAVEALGERILDPEILPAEKSRLHTALTSLWSDKAPEVRKAAAFYADLFKASGNPELVTRLLEEHRRAVDPTRRVIHLVDSQGRPVEGAVASTYFERYLDFDPSFTPPEPIEAATSNARGLLSLKLEIPGHLDGEGVYAIRPGKGRPLVGLRKVTREEMDRPITVVMHPACRVLFRIDGKGLGPLKEKYHAELVGPGWWRAAYVTLGGIARGPRPLFASSTTGELEFLLPPGPVTIHAYGSDLRSVERSIEIKPDDRELFLGTFDLPPSRDAEQGRFPNHHRVRQDPAAGGESFVFRRIKARPLRGMAREATDLAFSPDGKLLATAHAYNADPGEVKLWDMATGARITILPVGDRGIASLAFSPDGKSLAGLVHPLGDFRSSWEVILWDVASRREVRRFGGRPGWISTFAFTPDGQAIVTGGPDRAAQFWDAASGREIRRIDGPGSARVRGFSPDGQSLVMTGAGRALLLWDVVGNRLRATLEPETERFAVRGVTFAPDGRTLAAAGSTVDAKGAPQQGQVRLYDLTREPFARRAILTFDPGWLFGPNERFTDCSDVAFTPDGRRVVGIGELKIRIWDAATGVEQDAYEMMHVGSLNRLVISPDGRWLAVTTMFGAGVDILDITRPGP